MRAGRGLALALSGLLLVTACASEGDDGGEAVASEPAAGEEASADDDTPDDLQALTVLLPVEAPLEYPHRVAEELGYFAEEGITTSYEYSGGSSEVIQQLLAGNGELGVTCTGAVVESVDDFPEQRYLFTTVYGSIFNIGVPDDSPVQSLEDLRGGTIGISDLAGGEVPVIRGLLQGAGIDPDEDVTLLPIGEATAVGLRALEDGEVDAVGGSIPDFFGLRTQGMDLRVVGGQDIAELPACGVVSTADFVDANPDLIEGFLRATAKGQHFGQVDYQAALEVLRLSGSETFADQNGADFVDVYLPFMAPPSETYGTVTPDLFEEFITFVAMDDPGVDLTEVVITEFNEAANDFDRDAVAADAEAYGGG